MLVVKVLKCGDVLMKFDGVDVVFDGIVVFRMGECINFFYLVFCKYVGDSVVVIVLCDGKMMNFDISLTSYDRFVSVYIEGKFSSYYICVGIVFIVVCVLYL